MKNIISLSAGKDSTAVLLLAIERDIPDLQAVFCDTGNEHPLTYEYVDYLERRLCTDGTKNACSFLYARAAKVAALMGFKRIVTYILETESGYSLAASGWHCDKEQAGGGSWSRPSRPRESTAPLCAKRRYVKELR